MSPDAGRQLVRQRATAQLLAGGPAAAADVVRHLLAVQAQDLRSAAMAVRLRGGGDVAAALADERSLVVTWLMRGTLHMVAAEDYPWLLALTAPTRLTANARRLRQEGVSEAEAQRAVALITRALGASGPLMRAQLAERLAAASLPHAGQALPHLLMLAALRGRIVLNGRAFVLSDDWLGTRAAAAPSRDAALAELGRRYVRAHARAAVEDLAHWSGLPLRDARAALAAVAPAAPARAARRIPPRLLPAYDPYMLGWRDRSFAVPAAHAHRVHPGGGVIRPVMTDDGLVIGTWSLSRGLEPFEPLPPATTRHLEAELLSHRGQTPM